MVAIINELAAKVRLKQYLRSTKNLEDRQIVIRNVMLVPRTNLTGRSYRIDYDIRVSNNHTTSHMVAVNIETGEIIVLY